MTIYETDDKGAEQTMDDIREKLEGAKRKAQAIFYTLFNWAMDHPAEAAGIATAASIIIGKADRLANIRRGERLRNSMIYDRSLGMYWETKKPLTANQRLLIEARHKAGESYGQILSDMKVLKR